MVSTSGKSLGLPSPMKVVIFVSLALVAARGELAASAQVNRSVASLPAVIVFGDSIIDPGNNNGINTIVKCNFPPYGRDFAGTKPTGRFCNGRIPSDMLVQAFGIKEYLPAYLDPSLKLEDLLTGVSFASGGSGFDPLTSKIAEYVKKIKSGAGEKKASNIVTKSLYLVVCGSDDIANTYYSTPFRRGEYDIPAYTDLMVNSASSFFQELYGLGARKIGVLSLPPIGCVPSQRTLDGGLGRACSEPANQAATLFNSKLSSEIDSLNQKLPGANLIYIDIYSSLLSIIQNPKQHGFEVANRGCCGTGNIEVSVLCNDLDDIQTCQDDTKYVFWDSYHPTEKAYKILTDQMISKYGDKLN
ncbi:GDSL esterase/lipase EXL3-like isoform X2 [Syzygium oleosum]|uniref:GDSL esterase/lipase EXL3-like isoform X2 n=1 Tax=Syzygium oleosum TaxID=219896 RepID=UPI0024B8AF85|nr:GDSL esterase/lipase EXL3-like isoform X2 [Syzygium oleosum]